MPHAEDRVAGVRPDILDLSTLRPADDVVGRRVGDSAVLIRLATNQIYELNATGARVWEYVGNCGADTTPLLDRLVSEFEVDRDQADREIASLVMMLRAEGLLVDR